MVKRAPAVLIVDDEQITCDLLCEVLEEHGYHCRAVNSGEQALALLKVQEFDLAMLDIKMTGLSGLDVLATMSQEHRNTVVLMTTAVNDAKTAVEAMKMGAVDYIVKPFSVDQVAARVGRALRESAMRSGRNREANEPDGPADSVQAQIDAISRGIEAHVDRYDFHTRIVTEKTAEAARQLGLSESSIDAWVAARRKLERDKEQRMRWATGAFAGGPKDSVHGAETDETLRAA